MNSTPFTRRNCVRSAGFVAALVLITGPLRGDTVDDAVTALMAKQKINGLSLAVFQDGAIVKAKGYGSIDQQGTAPVTADTLFQAGSISKPVSALGVLLLVQRGQISLDANVNTLLKSWQVPENTFTTDQKVTVRRALSHSAGLTVHGFPGYAVDAAKPTLLQVLNGEKPANTPAIRVDLAPGSKGRYSGGGYTMLQQLVIDLAHQPFPQFMRTEVLEPLGMRASSFEQPLPADRAAITATGYTAPQKAVPGRWHVYPEMAAAGLWTTPSDLARLAIGMQDTLAGRSTPVISSPLAREMLTRQKDNAGLGFFLSGQGETQRFEHGGRDEGFDAQLTAYIKTRQGAAIMINANDNSGVIPKVMEAIADAYHWPDYPRAKPMSPIEDKEPQVTAQLKTIFEQAKTGVWDRTLYTEELAALMAPSLAEGGGARANLSSYGTLKSVVLLARSEQDGMRRYQYRFTYENATLAVRCAFNRDGKIAGLSFRPE